MSRKRRTEAIYRFNLNLPESLLKKVKICAERDSRSVTQQIITALKHMTREIKDEPTAITE